MLPHDQIPADRRDLLDVTGRLREDGCAVLGVSLAQWMARDDSNADPGARRAANTAMGAVDAMLAELHRLRARLVSEIRVSDDTAVARADELLAQLRDAPRRDQRASALAQLMTRKSGAQAPADAEAWAFE